MAIKDFYGTLMEQVDDGIRMHDSVKVRAANHSMALDAIVTYELADVIVPGKSFQLRVVDGTNGMFIDTYVGKLA